MRTAADVTLVCCLSAGSLLLGYALCFPCFSYVPLLWGVGLAVAFLACFAACVALRWKARAAPYVLTASGYSVAFVVAVVAFTNVERVERYECNWKMGADGVAVDLSPVGGFSWSRVDSDQLAHHLLKDGPPTVSVDVEVIRDFGKVRARGLILRVDGFPVREPEP
ncbi:MAG TPA: hypothetical protein VMS17_33600 [Gemmataceae bacterium]|nr:hypothetical protein [Gemmataceae bacterium]